MLGKVDYIIDLIGKHFRNELTPQESKVLLQWLTENEEHRKLLTLLSDDNAMEEEMSLFCQSGNPAMWETIRRGLKREPVSIRKLHSFPAWVYRAGLAFFWLSFLLIQQVGFNTRGAESDAIYIVSTSSMTASPDTSLKNKVMLTLSNGNLLNLSDSTHFVIRSAYMWGEAQFDVVKNADQPFRLTFPGNKTGAYGEILATGARFNVSSCDNEGYKQVTLLEGSLQISGFVSAEKRVDKPLILKPGQQARLSDDGRITRILKD